MFGNQFSRHHGNGSPIVSEFSETEKGLQPEKNIFAHRYWGIYHKHSVWSSEKSMKHYHWLKLIKQTTLRDGSFRQGVTCRGKTETEKRQFWGGGRDLQISEVLLDLLTINWTGLAWKRCRYQVTKRMWVHLFFGSNLQSYFFVIVEFKGL